jgi:hypothetical protein
MSNRKTSDGFTERLAFFISEKGTPQYKWHFWRILTQKRRLY